MKGYAVFVGEEELLIDNEGCGTHEKAKWIGAKDFRRKYGLKVPIALIVQNPYTKAFKLPDIPKDALKTDELVEFFKNLEPVYRQDTRGQKLNIEEE